MNRSFWLKIVLSSVILLSLFIGNARLETGKPNLEGPPNEPQVQVLEHHPDRVVFEITFPLVQTRTDSDHCVVTMGELPCTPDGSTYLLPSHHLLLPGTQDHYQLKVLDVESDVTVLSKSPEKYTGDVGLDPINDGEKQNFAPRTVQIKSNGWVSLADLGKVRGVPVTSLQIEPVRYSAQRHELVSLSSIKLQLDFPDLPDKGKIRSVLSIPYDQLTGGLSIPAFSSVINATPPASQSFTGTALKIFVSEEGLYHLSKYALQSWGVNTGVDPRTFRLMNRGEDIPLYVFGEADGRFDEGDYIEFWGEGLHGTFIEENPEIYSDLYTDVNVYWLTWGGDLGARLVEESGEIVQVNPLLMYRATSYPSFIHSEENNYYNRLSQVGSDSLKEHWYWDSGIQASETRNYDVFLPYPDENALTTVRVRTALMGLTYPNPNTQAGGQHHAYVSLNDHSSSALEGGSSGASWWVGQTGVILDAQGSLQGIEASALYHGVNYFSVFVPVDTDAGENDKVLLNWFEITYPRLYKAYDNQIKFAPPAAATDTLVDYKIDNFTSSNVDIFKIGQSKIINSEIIPYYEDNETFYEVHFQDRPFGNAEYVAITPDGKLSPDSVQLDQGSDVIGLLSSGSPIKLLVVAHRSFENHPDLEAYLSRRNATLGRTELIFIDDLFDELNYGIYNPVVIKEIMQMLPTPPQYLLLVGDGSYDTRDAYGYGGNLIPVHFIQTFAYGAVACDFWYGLLDDDLLPDVSVGRISARDGEQLSDYLQKLEVYETQTDPGTWRNKHLYVSGSPDNAGLSFQAQSEAVIKRLDEDVFAERLATFPLTSPFYGTTNELIDLFDEGVLAVDYNGHGAGAIWSDNSLFRLENLPQLSNEGMYPFVTNFTCFIGAFDTPQEGQILGEEFIFEPEKGAIAVLASTGLGWFYNGGWLQEELNDLLYDNTDLKLGDIINAAKIAYFSYYGQGGSVESFDTMHLMNLIGDPSLQLAFVDKASEGPEVTPEFASFDENVTVSLEGDFSNFQGVVRVYDEYDYPALEFGFPYEAILLPTPDGLETTFSLPTFGDSLSHASGNYRLCLWDPSTSETISAAAPLYLLDAYSDSTVFDSLLSVPSPIEIWDTFGFKAKLLDVQGIASAWAHFSIITAENDTIVEHDSLEMLPTGQPYWFATETVIDTTVYPYSVGDRVVYHVEAADTEGDSSTSNTIGFYILQRQPDPDWVDGSLRMDVRNGVASLIVEVTNKDPMAPWITGTEIDSIDVLFTQQIEGAPSVELGHTVLYDILIDSTVEASIPVAFEQPDLYDLEIFMNSEGWVDDVNPNDPYSETLRADLFNIDQSIGTGDTLHLTAVLDTVSVYYPAEDSTAIDSTLMIADVFIPPNGISGGSGVMRFGIADNLLQSPNQAELNFAYHNSEDEIIPGYGIELDFIGDISVLQDSLWMDFEITRYDSSIVIQDVKIHHQSEGQLSWQTVPGELTTLSFPPDPRYRLTATDERPGYYTLMQNGDHSGPTLEFSVEGQIYTAGGYVPKQPKISVLAQDFGGINQNPDSYTVTLDDEEQAPNTHVESNGQVMTLSINPTLASGNHSLVVEAEDMFGNSSGDSVQFDVTAEFRLDFIGNYPNPMADKTYFAYRLTEQTTSPVEIKIYTVSGRLIRTLHSDAAEEINYGEIYWDGMDQDGDMIANGVYFYKFIAKRNDEKIERTMTLAKLR